MSLTPNLAGSELFQLLPHKLLLSPTNVAIISETNTWMQFFQVYSKLQMCALLYFTAPYINTFPNNTKL